MLILILLCNRKWCVLMDLFFYLIFNFIIYSFFGWILEEVYCYYIEKRFKEDGFLFGPFKPMYGIAMTILVFFQYILRLNWAIMIPLYFIVPSTVEYLSGYLLKVIFNKSYWDYSNMKFNINGFVCLKFSIYWTVLSFLTIKYIQPLINKAFLVYFRLWFVVVPVLFIYIIIDFWLTVRKLHGNLIDERS